MIFKNQTIFKNNEKYKYLTAFCLELLSYNSKQDCR